MIAKDFNESEVMETPAVEAPKEETSVEEVVGLDVEAPKGEEEVAVAVEAFEGEVTETPAEEVPVCEAPVLVETVEGVEGSMLALLV
jgi:hypothetical protein